MTCETDRARFLGRGRTTRDPVALEDDGPLSGTTGAVLDPIFALRTRVRLRSRAVGVGRVHHAGRHQPGAGLRAGRPLPRSARRPARARPGLDLEPGRAARAATSRPATPPSSRSWPATSSMAAPRCGRRRPELRAEPGLAAAALGQRHLGRLADPARHHRLARRAADAAPAADARTTTGAGAG